MGVIEELVKNKEEILVSFLKILEGKEARTKVNLNGVEFKVGDSLVKMNGSIEFVFIPIEDKEKSEE